MRRAVTAVVAGFVALSLVRGAKIVTEGFDEGFGYSSRTWQSSPAVRYVDGLPRGVAVYSDDPYALLYLTEQEVHPVPTPIVRRLGVANPDYAGDVAAMRERLETTGGAVVIFERDRGTFDVPVLPPLLDAMPLRETKRFGDATVYALEAKERQGGY